MKKMTFERGKQKLIYRLEAQNWEDEWTTESEGKADEDRRTVCEDFSKENRKQHCCSGRKSGGVCTDVSYSSDIHRCISPYYDLEAPKRVYLCLQEDDQTWIGDLREWTYADVYEENVEIRMY